MISTYYIRDYCIIRNKQIYHKGELIFRGGEKQASPFFLEAYKHFNTTYPKFHKMDNLCKLGFLCSEVLLNGKDITQKFRGEEIGIILANSASSLDTDRIHQQSIHDRSAYFPSPSVFVYTLPNIVIGEICIRNKFFGENTFFIEKKFNPADLFTYVEQLFEENTLQCCLTGWLELDGDHYEGIMYLIEKSISDTDGIAIFEPGKLQEIYSQGI